MATHTPGEWVAIPPRRKGKHWRVGVGHPESADGRAYLLAIIDNGSPGDTLETEGANARLIAAAPALLFACERLLGVIDGRDPPDPAFAVEFARAAVAKAKGE